MVQKHKLKTVTPKHVVHQFVQNTVDMEIVLNHAELDRKQEQYINIVITTDNYVVVGMKVPTVIHIRVVHQHMDLVDIGQDVQEVVVQDHKITIVIAIVTIRENTVLQHIATHNHVIHIHVVPQHTDLVDTGQDVLLHVVEDGKIITAIAIVTIQENTVLHLIHTDKVVTLTHAVKYHTIQMLEHIVQQLQNVWVQEHGQTYKYVVDMIQDVNGQQINIVDGWVEHSSTSNIVHRRLL